MELLKDGDLHVTLVKVPDANLRWQLLAAGRLDLACGSLDSFVAALPLDPGVLLFKLGNSAGTDMLLGAEGTTTLRDVIDHDVAVVSGSPGRWFLTTAMAREGLSPSQVRLVEVDRPEDAERLLQAGKVRAACLWGTRALSLKARGLPVLLATTAQSTLIEDVCVVNRHVLQQNKAGLRTFLQTWFTIASLLRKRPGLVYDSLARRLDMGAGAIATLMDGEQFADLQENLRMDRDELVERLRSIQTQWLLLDSSRLRVPIRAEALLDSTLLETIELSGTSGDFGPPPQAPSPVSPPLESPSPSVPGAASPSPEASASAEPSPEASPSPSPQAEESEETP